MSGRRASDHVVKRTKKESFVDKICLTSLLELAEGEYQQSHEDHEDQEDHEYSSEEGENDDDVANDDVDNDDADTFCTTHRNEEKFGVGNKYKEKEENIEPAVEVERAVGVQTQERKGQSSSKEYIVFEEQGDVDCIILSGLDSISENENDDEIEDAFDENIKNVGNKGTSNILSGNTNTRQDDDDDRLRRRFSSMQYIDLEEIGFVDV